MAQFIDFESFGGAGDFVQSPGGFEFGLQGWSWPEQRPTSITFYLDNTAMVCDQFGRPIRGAVTTEGKEVYFAVTPPEGGENMLDPRPRFGTHEQVVDILLEERIDVIEEMNKAGTVCGRCAGRRMMGERLCNGCGGTGLLRVISVAGWPQLPYERLKKLKKVPLTPASELSRIRDLRLRKDALKLRNEADERTAREAVSTQED